jgi:hypothetical protein
MRAEPWKVGWVGLQNEAQSKDFAIRNQRSINEAEHLAKDTNLTSIQGSSSCLHLNV